MTMALINLALGRYRAHRPHPFTSPLSVDDDVPSSLEPPQSLNAVTTPLLQGTNGRKVTVIAGLDPMAATLEEVVLGRCNFILEN